MSKVLLSQNEPHEELYVSGTMLSSDLYICVNCYQLKCKPVNQEAAGSSLGPTQDIEEKTKKEWINCTLTLAFRAIVVARVGLEIARSYVQTSVGI